MGLKGKKFIVNKNKNMFDSFKHAFDGIKSAISTEYNMLIHCYMSVAVIICGVLFHISYFEWIICILLIGLVITLELINTAVESIVNMITTKYNVYAKIAKDTSAAAVMVMSVVAAVIGLIIFVPKFIALF